MRLPIGWFFLCFAGLACLACNWTRVEVVRRPIPISSNRAKTLPIASAQPQPARSDEPIDPAVLRTCEGARQAQFDASVVDGTCILSTEDTSWVLRTGSGQVLAELGAKPGTLEVSPDGQSWATVWAEPRNRGERALGCRLSADFFAGCLRARASLDDYRIISLAGIEVGAYCHYLFVHARRFGHGSLGVDLEVSDEWRPAEPIGIVDVQCSRLRLFPERAAAARAQMVPQRCKPDPAVSWSQCSIVSKQSVFEQPNGRVLGTLVPDKSGLGGRCQFSDSTWTRVEVDVKGGIVRGYLHMRPKRSDVKRVVPLWSSPSRTTTSSSEPRIRRIDCARPRLIRDAGAGVTGLLLRGDVVRTSDLGGALYLGGDATVAVPSVLGCQEVDFGELACAAR